MQLAVLPPVSPMLARPVSGLPPGDNLIFEPKWDGFRCIAFRDGDEVELGSRNERPLTRYFPEVVAAILAEMPPRCVVDGEIVIMTSHGLDFDALQQRIHPAASRVAKLASDTPASFVVFDLLALDDEDLCGLPFAHRRERLEQALAGVAAPIYLTPITTDRTVAQRWFVELEGAGLDGLIAKDPALLYRQDKRVMMKIKHERTADCVVAGFRWHKTGDVVGSLLLGLNDAEGVLHHVGVTASFTMARRRELVEELAPYRMESLEGHPWATWAAFDEGTGGEETQRRPGGSTSRWNAKKDLSWQPLRPELVCEVAYDHMQNDRFRHATTFRRWRTDRTPASCNYAQLETVVSVELSSLFSNT